MTSLLTGKTAVIYGGGGNIGGAAARAFAREGAQVHLVGRTRESLDRVAADTGAEVAVLDATDQAAVDAHADRVGRIDISFNLITREDAQGTPLADMEVDSFLHALTLGARTAFITSRAAARHMEGRRRDPVPDQRVVARHAARDGQHRPADAAWRRCTATRPPSSARAGSAWPASTPPPCAGR